MRILYLAQRVPYPPDRGDKIITYHQIRHLARHHAVAVACLADGEADLANVSPLAEWTTSVDVVLLRPRAARLRALAALASRQPVTLAYFNEQELHTRVAARLKAVRFDALVVYSSSMAQFVEPYRDVPRSYALCGSGLSEVGAICEVLAFSALLVVPAGVSSLAGIRAARRGHLQPLLGVYVA